MTVKKKEAYLGEKKDAGEFPICLTMEKKAGGKKKKGSAF